MEWNEHDIDEFGRSSLGSLEKEPPPMTFEKIRKRVLWYSIWTLGAGSMLRRFWILPLAAVLFFLAGVALLQSNSGTSSGQLAVHVRHHSLTLDDQNKSDSLTFQTATNTTFSQKTNPVSSANSNYPQTAQKNSGFQPLSVQTVPQETATDAKSNTANINGHHQKTMNSNTSPALTKAEGTMADSHDKIPEQLLTKSALIPSFINLTCSQPLISEVKNQKSINWSLKTGLQLTSSASFFATQAEESGSANRQISASVSPAFEIRASFKDWFLSTGIEHIQLKNKWNADRLLFNTTGNLEWQQVNSFWQVDTSGFWHYTYVADSIVHVVDSVWAWDYDSTLVQQFDSVYVTHADTANTQKWNRIIRMIEIPLMAGYTLHFGRLSTDLSAGLGAGLIYYGKGRQYTGLYSTQALSNWAINEQFGFSLNILLKADIRFHVSERWAIEFSPWYRKAILFPSLNENESVRPSSTGFSAGLRYFF